MNDLELQKKLKILRGSLTFMEFSRKVGLSDASLVRYEQGKMRPKYDNLKKIASACGVSISYLIEDLKEKDNRVDIKIVGMIPAGHTDIYDQPEVMDPIIVPFRHMKNCIAVQVSGQSMERLFYDSDILIIRERQDQRPRKNGLTYVVEWEEAERRMRAVKNIYQEDNGFRLVSENKLFKDIFTDNIIKLYRIIAVLNTEFRYQISQS